MDFPDIDVDVLGSEIIHAVSVNAIKMIELGNSCAIEDLTSEMLLDYPILLWIMTLYYLNLCTTMLYIFVN